MNTEEEDDEIGGLFTVKGKKNEKSVVHEVAYQAEINFETQDRKWKEYNLYSVQEDGLWYLIPAGSSNDGRDWKDEEVRATIADCFVTGKWEEEDEEEKKLKGEKRLC